VTIAQRTEVGMLVAAVSILTVAALASPGEDVVSLFGHPFPGMCVFRAAFGIPCPGCGMTRSFAFLAHGDLSHAFAVNKLGPVFFGWVVAQVPYRALRLWKPPIYGQ
jgi:hypothetical protein